MIEVFSKHTPLDPYRRAKWEGKQYAGTIIVDGQEIGHTLQCVHCNRHFLSIAGSGARRGWCMNCGGVTCGHGDCDRCMPFEKRLELFEAGKIGHL